MPTPPSDPAGLLERIPELEPLCADRWVRRAVASGDPLRVYRALFWARLTGRLRRHRGSVSRLLRTRRAFWRPLRGQLFLGTWNGMGASFVGKAEREEDGTKIATHALELLLGLPLFPLGAYVVTELPSSGTDDLWRIHARVPLGPFAWAWSRAVAVAALLAVAAVGNGVFHATRHREVVIVNGFEQPVQVTIGPTVLEVPGGQYRTVPVPTGTIAARAGTAAGGVVDEGPLEVGAGTELLVWNVGGSAPIMEREVLYTTESGSEGAAEAEPVFHCGERWLALRDVDFAFVDAPRTLSHWRGEPRISKRAVQVARQGSADGALLCAHYFLDRDDDWRAAAAMLERRARAAGWEQKAVEQAVWAARHVSAQEEQRILRAAVAAHPDGGARHIEAGDPASSP